jgi:hypothetical protein
MATACGTRNTTRAVECNVIDPTSICTTIDTAIFVVIKSNIGVTIGDRNRELLPRGSPGTDHQLIISVDSHLVPITFSGTFNEEFKSSGSGWHFIGSNIKSRFLVVSNCSRGEGVTSGTFLA